MDYEAQMAAALAASANDYLIVQAERELAANRRLDYASKKVFLINSPRRMSLQAVNCVLRMSLQALLIPFRQRWVIPLGADVRFDVQATAPLSPISHTAEALVRSSALLKWYLRRIGHFPGRAVISAV